MKAGEGGGGRSEELAERKGRGTRFVQIRIETIFVRI